ncbi:MAG: peptidase S41, partial [Perlabentimonas sp.]
MLQRIFAALIIATSIFVNTNHANAQEADNLNIFKMVRFLQYVSSDYVDPVDSDELVEDAIIKVLRNLDPHSVYISEEDVRAMNEPLEGNFEGIGVEFNI